MLAAIIFDVEGTLVDCVPHVLACWEMVLAAAGHHLPRTELQKYSGMDGGDMLDRLLPDAPKQDKERILKIQGQSYRDRFLQLGTPFPGVRDLLSSLKDQHIVLGIATSCKGDELREYDKRMQVLELVNAVACGDDASRGKPHPDLYQAVLEKLGVNDAAQVIAVGDSPYDAMAAKRLGCRAAGLLTGGFAAEALSQAGCESVLADIRQLGAALGESRARSL